MTMCRGCRQQEGTNQFSAELWILARLIIWVLTLFYVLRFYGKEPGSWVLQDTVSQASDFFFFFLQKEKQNLFILDHKEASPSLPHSSKRDNTSVLDIFIKITYTNIHTHTYIHIYVFCWFGVFLMT